MQEIWKDIKGFEGLYQVSSFGRIRSFKTSTKLGYGKKWHILNPTVLNTGYESVTLYKSKTEKKRQLVHRLVAENFIPNNNNYPCVNHKDENKRNNQVDNLEWCTYQYNNAYGTARIRIRRTKSKPIGQYAISGELLATYASAKVASILLNCSATAIKDCCNNKYDHSMGYIWRFIDKDAMYANSREEFPNLNPKHRNNLH